MPTPASGALLTSWASRISCCTFSTGVEDKPRLSRAFLMETCEEPFLLRAPIASLENRIESPPTSQISQPEEQEGSLYLGLCVHSLPVCSPENLFLVGIGRRSGSREPCVLQNNSHPIGVLSVPQYPAAELLLCLLPAITGMERKGQEGKRNDHNKNQ